MDRINNRMQQMNLGRNVVGFDIIFTSTIEVRSGDVSNWQKFLKMVHWRALMVIRHHILKAMKNQGGWLRSLGNTIGVGRHLFKMASRGLIPPHSETILPPPHFEGQIGGTRRHIAHNVTPTTRTKKIKHITQQSVAPHSYSITEVCLLGGQRNMLGVKSKPI